MWKKNWKKKRVWENNGKVFEGKKTDWWMKRDKKKKEKKRKGRWKENMSDDIFLFLSFLFSTFEIICSFLFKFLSPIYDSFGWKKEGDYTKRTFTIWKKVDMTSFLLRFLNVPKDLLWGSPYDNLFWIYGGSNTALDSFLTYLNISVILEVYFCYLFLLMWDFSISVSFLDFWKISFM
jgi:hypothetical protein